MNLEDMRRTLKSYEEFIKLSHEEKKSKCKEIKEQVERDVDLISTMLNSHFRSKKYFKNRYVNSYLYSLWSGNKINLGRVKDKVVEIIETYASDFDISSASVCNSSMRVRVRVRFSKLPHELGGIGYIYHTSFVELNGIQIVVDYPVPSTISISNQLEEVEDLLLRLSLYENPPKCLKKEWLFTEEHLNKYLKIYKIMNTSNEEI